VIHILIDLMQAHMGCPGERERLMLFFQLTRFTGGYPRVPRYPLETA